MIQNRNSPQPTPPAPPVAPSSRVNSFLAVFVFIMALYMVFTQVWPRIMANTVGRRMVDPRGELMEIEKTTTQLFQHSAPSVVFITNAQDRWDRRKREVFSVPSGSGSGFFWDETGHIVTNYHVIENADDIIVPMSDQTSFKAVVVGSSREDDLAVLRPRDPLTGYIKPITMGTSDDLQVGQEIFAIGNPFGFDLTLTRGIISALNRDLPQQNGVVLQDLMQTDAAINPGNSGGPLLDSASRLIGVATAIISPSNANAGIGFAIPVDRVQQVVPQLIKHGKAVKPIFGVRLAMNKLRNNGVVKEVLTIKRVYPNTPAERAGLLGEHSERGFTIPGETLLEIDGQPIRDMDSFNDVMTHYEVGNTVTIKVRAHSLSASIVKELELTLVARPDG